VARMRRVWLAVLVAVALAGCFRGRSGDSEPPPRGKTMDQYLDETPAEDRRRPRPAPPPPATGAGDFMRLHVIDVGQGAAQLLEFPCAAVLVDTGGEKNRLFDGEKALVDYLDRFFERRRDLDRTLALLVVTHPHLDHTRGIAAVLERYRVLNVIDNGDVREDEGGRPQLAMHEWLLRHPRVGHLDLSREDIDDRGGVTGPVIDPVGTCPASAVEPVLHALWSGDLGREEIGHDPNNDSVVLRIDFGDASAILPGDIEHLAIARLVKKYEASPQVLDADVYVVSHHGSRNSTTADLVARVSPEVAVISAGPYERQLGEQEEYTARAFGHPSQAAIDHLTRPRTGVRGRRPRPIEVWVGQRGAWKGRPSEFQKRTITAAVYTTGWDGTIVVTGHANGWIEVATQK
jgi:competence protein ComEC